jgi:molybdate transport system permease protein
VSSGAARGASVRSESARARLRAVLGPAVVSVLTAVVIAVVMAFFVLPVVGLVVYQPFGQLLHGFNSKVVTDAITVTLKTNAIAMGLTLILGTPFAYVIGRHRFPGRSIVITLVELPLVMPPAVAGIALLVTYGRLGLLGHQLTVLGVTLGFSQAAVVMAITLVASPFYVRGAIGAFEAIDGTLLDVAGTLGAGTVRRMVRVGMPLARAGLVASGALCFARGIGEFGATILFAGSFQGTTQTMTTAIYQLFGADMLGPAVAVGVLLLIVSAVILLTIKLLGPWASSRSTSSFRGGRSSSARSSA